MVPFKERNLENSAFNNFPWVGWFVARPRLFCCLQARQGCLQVVSKVIPKLPQVWLFASKTDCRQVVPKLSRSCHRVWLFASKTDGLQFVPKLSRSCNGVWMFASKTDCLQFVPKLSESCHEVWLFASKTGCLEPHKPPDPGEHESPPPPTLNTLC